MLDYKSMLVKRYALRLSGREIAKESGKRSPIGSHIRSLIGRRSPSRRFVIA